MTEGEMGEAMATDPMREPTWDDRKELLDIWQQHAPLPEIGLRDGIYDALLAVALWGYAKGVDA